MTTAMVLDSNGAPPQHGITRVDPNTAALTAQATAQVQARYLIARSSPRSWQGVRIRLLQECTRKGFAERARFRKPQGFKDGKQQYIEGPSVRFAESALRDSGNMEASVATLFDDARARTLRVSVTDYETNAIVSADVAIEKTVERSNPKDRKVLGERTNSAGETVYIVACTDDELLIKSNAAASKVKRNLILALLPSDIVDECMDQCITTVREGAKDVLAERKKLCDAFAVLGVRPTDLEAFLGHSLDALHPTEIGELREVYTAIKDGETKWADMIEARTGNATTKPETPTTKKASVADKVKRRGKEAPVETKTEAPKSEPPPEESTPQEPAQAEERQPGEEG